MAVEDEVWQVSMANQVDRLGKTLDFPTENGVPSVLNTLPREALLDLIADNTINGKIAKQVFEEMVATGAAPAAIVEAKGLRQVTDTSAIDAAVDAIMAANPDKVAEYRSGKDKLFGFFVGAVMKAMAGKGNPALVNAALKARIG